MGRLTQGVVIEADVAVRRMSHDQKVHLADEVHARQPTMLASILVLPRMGVEMAQLEVALHILRISANVTARFGQRDRLCASTWRRSFRQRDRRFR